ncbi:hypothetical protein [Agilicoccus flavus]|uniref:hypothetical protein n=1 Tax=Agilicoccus flavus TaxID=2775968 RepID=UPI001CF66F4A|nr:hypothetical protein [Agilicoccus flavus]
MLTAQLRARTHDALSSLRTAHDEHDDHLEGIRLGELESLARTALEHDVDIPELEPFRPRAG